MAESEMRFIEAFRELQRLKRMNLTGFAEATGTNKSTLCDFKNMREGKVKSAKVEWLQELAMHYGVSAEWLLTGKGEMFRE